MSQTFGVLIIMINNYFHDVATVLFDGKRYCFVDNSKKISDTDNNAVIDYFLNIFSSMTRLARFALIWIIVGGVPRTIFYVDFEWSNAVGKN